MSDKTIKTEKISAVSSELINTATESKAATAVLQSSLQFTKVMDTMNSQRINETLKNQKSIADLRVDNKALELEAKRLRESANKIIVHHDPFGLGSRKVVLDVNDSEIKELVDEAKASEINNLKKEIANNNRDSKNAIDRKSLENDRLVAKVKSLELNAEEAAKSQAAEYKVAVEALNNESEEYRVRHAFQLANRDEAMTQLKFEHNSTIERKSEEYSQAMRAERLDYKRYKEEYSESLNTLRIEIAKANEKLILVKNSLKRNWFVRNVSKALNSVINDFSSINWTAVNAQRA